MGRRRLRIAAAGCMAAAAWAAQAPAAGAPPTRYELPAGVLRLSDSRVPAGARERLTFSVLIDRAVTTGRLALTLPRLWTRRSQISGVAYAKLPARGRASSARARVDRDGRVVSFRFTDARDGEAASFDVRDNGLPAGTYRLPYSWRENGSVRARGTARVVLSARRRER